MKKALLTHGNTAEPVQGRRMGELPSTRVQPVGGETVGGENSASSSSSLPPPTSSSSFSSSSTRPGLVAVGVGRLARLPTTTVVASPPPPMSAQGSNSTWVSPSPLPERRGFSPSLKHNNIKGLTEYCINDHVYKVCVHEYKCYLVSWSGPTRVGGSQSSPASVAATRSATRPAQLAGSACRRVRLAPSLAIVVLVSETVSITSHLGFSAVSSQCPVLATIQK